ncbi:hypothetical protein ACQJBY_016832 [Aegilops geniculata]
MEEAQRFIGCVCGLALRGRPKQTSTCSRLVNVYDCAFVCPFLQAVIQEKRGARSRSRLRRRRRGATPIFIVRQAPLYFAVPAT